MRMRMCTLVSLLMCMSCACVAMHRVAPVAGLAEEGPATEAAAVVERVEQRRGESAQAEAW